MNQITIRMGEYDFNKDGESLDNDYKLTKMIAHANYDSKTFDNDIALLKLDRPVTRSRSVYPICLPPRDNSYANTRANVIGKD